MSNGRCKVCNAVNADDSRLKLDWEWNALEHVIQSFAHVGLFVLIVDIKDESYEATLMWDGHILLTEDGFDTRLHAQIAAEGLLSQMHHLISFARKGVDSSEQWKKDKDKPK